MIARFPGGNLENPDTTDWLIPTVISMKADPRISEVFNWRIADTPITMGRNHALVLAQERDIDFIVMIDSDMKPDAYHSRNTSRLALDPEAKLFWDTSFDFAYDQRFKHDKPCMIAAPYCGPPPHENIYVFHWESKESGHPIDQDMSLEQYSRRHASEMKGIVECGALPTGLIIIDMETVRNAPLPLTYYEWSDTAEIRKASTEDVAFTRDACLRGYPMFCNWDAWCGHWKRKCVGRPVPMTGKQIGRHFREAIMHEMGADSRKGEEFQIIKSHGSLNLELPISGSVEEKPDLSGVMRQQLAHGALGNVSGPHNLRTDLSGVNPPIPSGALVPPPGVKLPRMEFTPKLSPEIPMTHVEILEEARKDAQGQEDSNHEPIHIGIKSNA